MYIIADSGSTKTEWKLVSQNEIIGSFNTIGLNPYFVDEGKISSVVENKISSFVENSKIKSVFFYGAGCLSDANKKIVQTALSKVFCHAKIEVDTDLLGAARALFKNKNGIACILGTGSNSCLYDGENIVENVPSLGYVFGDEGGGVYIGKKLIAAFLRDELPDEISEKLQAEYKLNRETILNSVYKENYPNRYLASFCIFVKDNISNPFLEEIVKESFREFIKYQLSKYSDYSKMPIGFIGSIAFNFKKQLSEVLEENGLKLSEIEKSPIDGLIEFHS